MNKATLLQTSHWLPWGMLGDGIDRTPVERRRVAAKVSSLRRDGADPHYAWLAALEETGGIDEDDGHWVRDGKAVG